MTTRTFVGSRRDVGVVPDDGAELDGSAEPVGLLDPSVGDGADVWGAPGELWVAMAVPAVPESGAFEEQLRRAKPNATNSRERRGRDMLQPKAVHLAGT